MVCKEHTSWIGSENYYDSDAKEHRSRDTEFKGDKEVLSIKQWLYGDRMCILFIIMKLLIH